MAPTETTVMDALDAYFEGLRHNDASAVPFADDVVLENPRTRLEGEPLVGREAVVDFFETAAGNMPRVEVHDHVVQGATACSRLEWDTPDDTTVHTVDWFEFVDDEIDWVGIYFDRGVFMAR